MKSTRRELLAAGAALGLGGLATARARSAPRDRACIFIVCTGGMSQLDTWDPKPNAPAEARGPYRAIPTSVPGLQFAETLPQLARLASRFSVIRTLNHGDDSLHETGLQRIQTGAADLRGPGNPCVGAAVTRVFGARPGLPGHVILPRPLADTGLAAPQGQGAGFLGPACEALVTWGDPAAPGFSLARALPEGAGPLSPEDACGPEPGPAEPPSPALRSAFELAREPQARREAYGSGTFGQSLLLARRLVEHGVRVVTVNQDQSLFGGPTWDCHGYADLPTRVADLKDRVARPFDQGVAALIRDLVDRGLWGDTLVVCVGEFGRTPHLNAGGGRDHWTRCWSAMLGGGGLPEGVVVGRSDALGAEPAERPVSPADLLATVHRSLGLPAEVVVDGTARRLLPAAARPLAELGA
jgi:uncharacterized protein (DUF1501 family)